MHQFSHRNRMHWEHHNYRKTLSSEEYIFSFSLCTWLYDNFNKQKAPGFYLLNTASMFAERYWKPGDTEWPSGGMSTTCCCSHQQESGRSPVLSPPCQRTFRSTTKYLNCHAWLASDRGQEKRNGLFQLPLSLITG